MRRVCHVGHACNIFQKNRFKSAKFAQISYFSQALWQRYQQISGEPLHHINRHFIQLNSRIFILLLLSLFSIRWLGAFGHPDLIFFKVWSSEKKGCIFCKICNLCYNKICDDPLKYKTLKYVYPLVLKFMPVYVCYNRRNKAWCCVPESIQPNFDFFVFLIFAIRLGYFKAQTIFFILQTLKLNNEKRKKSSFMKKKVW